MSKEEQVTQLTEHMAKFIAHVAKKLPDDVIAKLEELRDKEDSPLSKTIYDTMFKNQELAVKLNRPSCQDTGVLQFWVKCGTKFPLIGEVRMLEKEHQLYSGTSFLIQTNVKFTHTWLVADAPFQEKQWFLCQVKDTKE